MQLVRDCQQLMDDLCMEPERDGSSELDCRIAGSLVRSKDDSFTVASKRRLDTCVGINAQALEELTQLVAKLHGEKHRRKAKLEQMGGEIAVLWEKLLGAECAGTRQRYHGEGRTELQRLHARGSAI